MEPSHVNPDGTETVGAIASATVSRGGARRVRAVIAALRQQASVQSAETRAGNRDIHQAIREFEAELADA
jgi:hypothetical protein